MFDRKNLPFRQKEDNGMKKLLGRFVVLLGVMVLAFLNVVQAVAAEPVELRMTWWGSQTRHDQTIKVIELFQKQYPDIKIVYEFSGWGDYWTKLAPQVAGGNLPDLMQQDYAKIAEWVSKDLLLPLDDYAKSKVLDFTNVTDAMLEGGKVNGKLYGVNLGNNSQAWILDVDAFNKVGIPLPPQKWTWEDFEKISVELYKKTGLWSMGHGLADIQLWKSLYLGYGQWSYSDDGKSLGYTDDQPFINHLKMILRLQDAGAIPTREVELSEFGVNPGPETSSIVRGKSAMNYYWSNQLAAIWKAAGENRNFTLTHLPRPKDGCCSSNYFKPSMFFSITKNAKHPKEAALFINFFINSLEANQIMMAERGVPISTAVQEGLKPLLSKPQKEMFDFLARVQADHSPIRPPDPAAHTNIQDNVYNPEVIDPVLMRKITPEEGVATLRKMATELLSK
jgi:multiple sugar transport system substrate-binding protein